VTFRWSYCPAPRVFSLFAGDSSSALVLFFWTTPHSLQGQLCTWRRPSRYLPKYRPLSLRDESRFRADTLAASARATAHTYDIGGRGRNSLVFPRMPVSPLSPPVVGELIVANNDVLHFSAFRFNELRSRLVHYRHKKASLNPRDCQCSLHCSPRTGYTTQPQCVPHVPRIFPVLASQLLQIIPVII